MVFREDLSDVQRTLLAVLPVPTAVLSLLGSFLILVLVCRSPRRLTSYKRILIGLSLSDILLTSTIATGPLFEPRIGNNQAICSLTGFLAQTSLLSNSFYSSFLAFYFLYTVRIGWSPNRFARLIEPWVHGFIAAFIVVTGTISLSLNVFEKAPTGSTCWIGNEYSSLLWLIMIIVGLAFGAIIAANLSIYLHVRFLTKRSLRRSMNPSVATKQKHLVATQSFCYVAAYALTYIPSFIMGLHLMSGGVLFRSTTTYFVIDAVYLVSMPLTGFLNLMVFLRPRYLQYREEHPNASNWRYFQLSLSTVFTGTKRQPRIIHEPDPIEHLPIEDNTPVGQESVEHDAESGSEENMTNHSDTPV